tara:strand:+ start:9946 stop:10077 length:132 start_codon:yes stop_codon:yes gene_type:complete
MLSSIVNKMKMKSIREELEDIKKQVAKLKSGKVISIKKEDKKS